MPARANIVPKTKSSPMDCFRFWLRGERRKNSSGNCFFKRVTKTRSATRKLCLCRGATMFWEGHEDLKRAAKDTTRPPHQSHSRIARKAQPCFTSPCFVVSTVAKRILNPFRLGCKLFARLSAASGGGRAFGAEGGEAQIPPAEGGKQKEKPP